MQGVLRGDIHTKLLAISAASIDRVFKPYKYLEEEDAEPSQDLSFEVRSQFVKLSGVNIPGYLEGDTVAHYGDLSG